MTNAEPVFTWPNGKRAAVSLSFDDARPSQLDNGLPIFERCGVRATFYVSPARMRERLGDWQAAAAAGHEIGNHTVTHPCSGNFPWSRGNALEDYTLPRMEQELLEANAFIRETIGATPTTFAYCCGQKYVGRGAELQSYVPLVARHFVVGRGFRDESVNDPGFVDLAQTCGIESDGASFDDLRGWIESAQAVGGWVIFVAHDIGDEFVRQAIRPRALEAVCRHCADPNNALWLDTVAAVGAWVQRWQSQRVHANQLKSTSR